MTTLVTGFDPFDAAPQTNPSASVTMALEHPAVDTLILPTSYKRSVEALDNRLKHGDINAVIMLGYAKNIPGIRLEKCARNRINALRPDNDGVTLRGFINPTRPDVVSTKTDIDALSQLAHGHCPVFISTNAGGYVCNYIYYHVLQNWPSLPSLFIHLSNGQDTERFPGIVTAIEQVSLEIAR